MRRLLLFLFLLLFISCNQEDEKEKPHQENYTKITMSNIHHVYNNYKEAFSIAQKEQKPLFILFRTQYCRWCKKLKETTLKNSAIVNRLNNQFIVLILDKNYSNYPSKYKVNAVPMVYITNYNEEIFTSIVGYHKNPYDYIKWFDYVKVELSK